MLIFLDGGNPINGRVDDQKLAMAWTQQNDSEAYTLFGDPAIRLSPKNCNPFNDAFPA